ncbi:NAD(P)/FAD-dependent oxidoreductase [Nocardia carnea]|uniref:NAD(P)/FAD-dependent oxidoreductase n=1 Tax=Nocardia carnea TaxID=37328 RepID=UPI002455CCF4|nr:FAD-dependent monooxygenase [Nocardia carnea]
MTRAVSSGCERLAASGARGTVVVIGGGLAGTLTVWALRGLAARVIVIERDRYPVEPQFRSGVPQARHAHLVLEAGHRALEAMLPGVRDQLHAAGATTVAMSRDLRWLSSAGWMADHDSGLGFLSCTRPVLDHVVRARVQSEAGISRIDDADVGVVDGTEVQFWDGCEVTGLLGTAHQVHGVRVRRRGKRQSESTIAAQWVIDASGRSSRVPRWLEELGCAPPPTSQINAGVGYRSRLVTRPPTDLGFRALYLQTRAPDSPFTAAVLPVERGRWLVSVGVMNSGVGADEQGFDAIVSQLRDPIVADTLARTEPASETWGFRPGASVRRRYERRAPEGLVAIGDAACTFNPVYGQGCTVAILGADGLREAVLRQGGISEKAARLARHRIAAVAAPAWMISSSEDLRFPATTGGSANAYTRTQHHYLDRVLAASTTDTRVTAAFHEVMSLVAPPTRLFRPQILGRVLRGSGVR